MCLKSILCEGNQITRRCSNFIGGRQTQNLPYEERLKKRELNTFFNKEEMDDVFKRLIRL